MADEDEWLDAEAAARYINLPVRSIYRLIHDGRLEAVRLPVRVRRHELDACLERCRIRPGEVAHLNAYPGGASRVAEPPLTKQGRPDRRYGRRY
jgi:excisionase family DNA binding protein